MEKIGYEDFEKEYDFDLRCFMYKKFLEELKNGKTEN